MAYKMSTATSRSIDTEMDEAGRLIDLLTNTFGSDSKVVQDATATYVKIITSESPSLVDYATGSAFLRWVAGKPDRLSYRPLKPCSCTAKFVDMGDDEWRPCERCIPEAYAKWAESEGIIDDEY